MAGARQFIAIGVAVVVALYGVCALAKEVTVKLKNGEEICGELVSETSTTITIKLATGATRTVPLVEVVGGVRERLTMNEEYRSRRSKVADGDVEGRLAIARWLFENTNPAEQRQALGLALMEVDAVQKLAPGSQQADLLRRAVEQKLKAMGVPIVETPGGEEPVEEEEMEMRPLTEEEVRRVKVFEVVLEGDPAPRVAIEPEVAESFWKKYTRAPVQPEMQAYVGREGERAFKQLQGYQQLDLMIAVRAREYYGKVEVRMEPASLNTWRTQLHPQHVVKYCGGCHQREEVGGLELLRGRATAEGVAYSNLIRLSRVEVDGQPMIDRTRPEESLLLQYGLNRKDAMWPHPDVAGFRPRFRSTEDPQFQRMADWLGGSGADGLISDPREMLRGSGSGEGVAGESKGASGANPG